MAWRFARIRPAVQAQGPLWRARRHQSQTLPSDRQRRVLPPNRPGRAARQRPTGLVYGASHGRSPRVLRLYSRLPQASSAKYPRLAKTLPRHQGSMNIFLTGCGSFIGRHILRLCKERGIEVAAVDLVETGQPGCSVADICSPAIADQIPANVDAVVHLAALSR